MTTESECRTWRSIADLVGPGEKASIGLIGAPLNEKSLTPGRCDLAPKIIRETLRRFSVYDVETSLDLSACAIRDGGDLNLKTLTPEEAFDPIKTAVSKLSADCDLTIVLGGNNAVTRPALHGSGEAISGMGLITLDAHFDLRDTDCGMVNGNPVRALLEDGLPGANIAQIGLAPFANTRRMHETAADAGVSVYPINLVAERGVEAVIDDAITTIAARCDAIFVDFDIDVIDRAQCPGAPGARPGGMDVRDFFRAARLLAAHPKVRTVDLTEFDPSIDVSDITALTAGRWAAEILAGFSAR